MLKSVLRIVVLTLVGIEVIGCFCINSLMFHPVRQYDAGHPGYVDVGTNGVKIAAIVCGLILQAPCLSAPRVVTKVRVLPIDPFPNLKRIGKIKCPLTVIHGTDDSIIPFAQGKELFGLAPEPKRFVAVEGADHNDLISVLGLDEYRKVLKDFVR